MKAVVTGGGGFLGSAIVRQLAARGDQVLSISRSHHTALDELGVEQRSVDLRERDSVHAALEGADCVFHVAAKTDVWGAREDFVETNVTGTANVIAAARSAGVGKLIFTSSPSVCFDGESHVNASNDLPYATRFLSPYPETKAIAERAALAANGDDLLTCALRPHLIIGPGDPHLVPRLLAKAAAKKLAIVGPGDNEVSLTFVDNAAHAHLCAADRLEPGAPHAGRAYFVSQLEPVQLWPWINALLERLDLPPVTRRVPVGIARNAGALLEILWRTLRLAGEPPMMRFVAAQLATSHSYSMEPARRDFGYEEQVSLAEANDRVVESLLRARA
ncbi:MAG: nucleoside-diphosphate-sugar epimerase [Chlamydiales bacterium]|jgi:nucleoside-diphosphate-sugar epimerase